MQKMHWAVILFYYSVVALISISITYVAMTAPNDELLRVFNYSGEQYTWILITATCNMIALISKTISNQNEKSGIITMFSYIGIVYACLLDFLIFDEYLNWLEWMASVIIMGTVLALTLHLLLSGSKKENDKAQLKVSQDQA